MGDIWTALLVGLLAAVTLIWFGPGVTAMIERSKRVKADWPAVVVPLVVVVLFVVFLISMVR